VTWRSEILQHAAAKSRTVAQTCRYFGISRKTYYKWGRAFWEPERRGDAVLIDERAARRVAEQTGLKVIGTLDVLLEAKRAGHATRIRADLDRLVETSIFSVLSSTTTSCAWRVNTRATAAPRADHAPL
jgi:transposase-like protein